MSKLKQVLDVSSSGFILGQPFSSQLVKLVSGSEVGKIIEIWCQKEVLFGVYLKPLINWESRILAHFTTAAKVLISKKMPLLYEVFLYKDMKITINQVWDLFVCYLQWSLALFPESSWDFHNKDNQLHFAVKIALPSYMSVVKSFMFSIVSLSNILLNPVAQQTH